MSLRIAFDMDGVLADFNAAYREVEVRLFGAETREATHRRDERKPLAMSDSAVRKQIKRQYRKRTAVWEVIRTTPDFWVGLTPIASTAVRKLYALTIEHRWEVFFITQRPATLGDTVQRQTQRWLHEQGFDMPSVLAISGSRSAAAGPLSLDYYVDDNAANCVDLTSDSAARSILIVDDDDETTLASARRLGIATARNIEAALDILDSASAARSQWRALRELARLVGWK